MIGGVVVLAGTGHIPYAPLPGDDASGTPVTATGGRHRVFAVVAALLWGKLLFKIAKNAAILARIRERAATANQLQGFGSLRRQIGEPDRSDQRRSLPRLQCGHHAPQE